MLSICGHDRPAVLALGQSERHHGFATDAPGGVGDLVFGLGALFGLDRLDLVHQVISRHPLPGARSWSVIEVVSRRCWITYDGVE